MRAVPNALELFAALLRDELTGSEALQVSQQMFTLVADNIPQAIFWKDLDSIYLGGNQRFADYAGVSSAKDLIGLCDSDFPWGREPGDMTGRVWFRDWDKQVISTGKPLFDIEERLRLADGSLIWIETTKVPLKDLEGTVVGILGVFSDVTDRRAAAQKLQHTLNDLDGRVQQRTRELSRVNANLQAEVDRRRLIEEQERRQRSEAEILRDLAAGVVRSLDVADVVGHVLSGLGRIFKGFHGYVLLDENDEASDDSASPHVVYGVEGIIDIDLTGVIERLDGQSGVLNLRASEIEKIDFEARAGVAVPLVAGDRLIGVLLAATHAEKMDVADAAPVLIGADIAAAAIANCRLLETTRHMAVIEERQRLARDLHDSVSQTLWTACLVAHSMVGSVGIEGDEQLSDNVERLDTLTRGALAEMRTLLLELRPSAIAESSLAELLGQLGTAFESRKRASCIVEVPDDLEVGGGTKEAFYRITQEAINNVIRHAGATRVVVGVSERACGLVLVIHDDGAGFRVGSVTEHLGISIMRERAAAVGAHFEVASTPGVGTTVTVVQPIQRPVGSHDE